MRNLLLAILILSFSSLAAAHEVRPAFLRITELQTDIPGSLYEASLRQPQIDGRYLGLELASNCEAAPVSARITDGALIEVSELNCGEEGLQTIEIVGLERTLVDALVSLERVNGETVELLITGSEPRIDLANATPNLPVYLAIGIEHLLFGFDHVLFVIMLLYLVRNTLEIVKVVTSFTLAHSLTLALSALDIVTLSPAPVEAVIAGSIVLLAYENLNGKTSLIKQYPFIVAFAFGLLHGLGFAGALSEIGLPESGTIAALFLFNLGIELGQLAIIALVITALAVFRMQYNRLAYEAPIYFVGCISSFWFFQRSWQILSPLVS
ncbi:MAG: hypothetical protein ACI9JU_002100 [Pseudohongiellaceae bacterium]